MFVFDIDGTLIDHDLILHQEEINCINNLLSHGDIVCFASGRPYIGTMKFMKFLNDGQKYLITSNGAVVYKFDGTIIYGNYLKMSDYIDVYNQFSYDSDFTIMIYQNNMIGYSSNKEYVEIEMQSNSMESNYIDINTVNRDERIEKIMVASRIKTIKDIEVPQGFYKRFNVVSGSERFMEFTKKGVDKCYALDYLRRYLHIKKKDIWVFGDSGNDYLMIKNYNSVCMENGFEKSKKVATFVTKPVCEHGVCWALDKITNMAN